MSKIKEKLNLLEMTVTIESKDDEVNIETETILNEEIGSYLTNNEIEKMRHHIHEICEIAQSALKKYVESKEQRCIERIIEISSDELIDTLKNIIEKIMEDSEE